jgi:hypothetical protein
MCQVVSDARNVLDLNQKQFFYPWGRREPFFTDLLAWVWSWVPGADGIVVLRAATAFVDGLLLWVLYLIGRELSGRRLGLVLTALAATSKPLWLVGLLGCGNTTATLASCAAMLFTFRVLRRPCLAHFLQWGVVLGLGAYTYMPYRPWAPVLATLVLGRTLLRGPQERPGALPAALSLCLWIGTSFLFLDRQNFLPRLDLPAFLSSRRFWVLWAWVLAAVSAVSLRFARRPPDREMSRWNLAVLAAGSIMSPLVFDFDYSVHVANISILHRTSRFLPDADTLGLLASNVLSCVRAMFGDGLTDMAYTMRENVFFDLITTLGFWTGVAALAASRRRLGAFLLPLAGLGMLPYVLGQSPHSARLATVIGPVLIAAGLGFTRLWDELFRAFPSRSRALTLLMTGLWAGHLLLYVPMMASWFAGDGPNTVLSRIVSREAPLRTVFLAPLDAHFFDPLTQRVLNDGQGVRLLSPRGNNLFLREGEPGRDVVVLLSDRDTETKARIGREFPSARWTPIDTTMPVGHPYAWSVLVPAAALSDDPADWMRVLPSDPRRWRRRLYDGVFGLGRGLIVYEDEVESLDAPWPCESACVAQVEGTFVAEKGGQHLFRTDSMDPVVLTVDGRTILAERDTFTPVRPGRGEVFLETGPHRVAWTSYVRLGRGMPAVLFSGPVGEPWRPLGRP